MAITFDLPLSRIASEGADFRHAAKQNGRVAEAVGLGGKKVAAISVDVTDGSSSIAGEELAAPSPYRKGGLIRHIPDR